MIDYNKMQIIIVNIWIFSFDDYQRLLNDYQILSYNYQNYHIVIKIIIRLPRLLYNYEDYHVINKILYTDYPSGLPFVYTFV